MHDKPLNGLEVQQIVGCPIKIIVFGDIDKYELDQLFEKNDCCLINYLSGPRFGHWCCLVRNGNKITYFNPSGRFIDEAINHLPEDFKYLSNQAFPHLLQKLYDSKYKVRYMDHCLQKNGTNTCGRYCGLFMRMRTFSEDDIIKLLGDKTNDEIIKLTNPFLKQSFRVDPVKF